MCVAHPQETRWLPAAPAMSDNRGVDMCSIRSFAAFLLLAAGAAAQSASNPSVDRIFARWDRGDSPGCALAVMPEGHIVYSRGYGRVRHVRFRLGPES